MKNSNRSVISKPVLQPIREPYLTTQSVLSVYLSICLSVYQKHNYLALYCQLMDSLCYLFPVIFLCHIRPFLQFKQDIKKPGTVFVEK